MECEIIRDLMPLYADGLTGDASNRLIKAHTAECAECRQLLEEMCTPMEPEPIDEEQKIMQALRIQKRKQRLRVIVPWILAVLACVIGWWIYMETHFYGEKIVTVSTDEENILKEMPELALTDAEKALALTILEVPLIRDALSDDYTSPTVFETEEAVGYFSSILPEDANVTEIAVNGHAVYFSYNSGNVYTIMEYNDPDMTGHVDSIFKYIAVSPLDKIGEDGVPGDVDTVYGLRYAVGTDIARYEKTESQHMWFSFLNMP